MRIAYGVFGYGRGHATRALTVLPELTSRHDVLLLASADAYDAISPSYPVTRLPAMGYVYGDHGERCLRLTFQRNFGLGADLTFGGVEMRKLEETLRQFRPDVIISDAEPWLHAVATRLQIPRISFDHFGVLAWCRPPVAPTDRLRVLRDVAAYRAWIGRPDRVIVSSFYPLPSRHPGVRVIGPLCREEIRQATPTRGDHVLTYFNKGDMQLTPKIDAALRALDVPVHVYGTSRRGADENIVFKAPGNQSFVDDLASCRAVFSTAGNQLVGEAIYLGKPMLVTPEHTVEQRCNGLALDRIQMLGVDDQDGCCVEVMEKAAVGIGKRAQIVL